MMPDYWKSFWSRHASANRDSDPRTQVLRTLNKRPVDPAMFEAIAASVVELVSPHSESDLLDLCCGNGMLTRSLFGLCRSVTAVDLAQEFVDGLVAAAPASVRALAADARAVEFESGSFDRILLYAGLQYFSESETVDLFLRMRKWLRPGGLVVLGDVPDVARRWNFFDTRIRESAYFSALAADQPLVGYWFDKVWLEKLARHVGFASAESLAQPESLPYQHYRFDMVITG